MIKLVEVQSEDRELLWNVQQKYLYEMTNYYDDEMDEVGNYNYGYFDAYFSEPQRKALFILIDNRLAGFAMINPYSYVGETPDHVLAEFTIFPVFRKKHVATEAAEMIFGQNKGHWEVKYNENNVAAKKLWNKVSEKYGPRKIKLNQCETVLTFWVK